MHHDEKVKRLQALIQQTCQIKKDSHDLRLLAMNSRLGHSNTAHSKSYKKGCHELDVSGFNRILTIDLNRQTVLVEPRITFETLVQALASYGYTLPVIPECKGITIGGAIMGAAAESSSFRWGCFHDTCVSFEILCGDGTLLKATSDSHSTIFYGVAGSYGTLGLLVSAEIKIVPAKAFVHQHIHCFLDPAHALQFIQEVVKSNEPPDFIDGIIFSQDSACVLIGNLLAKEDLPLHLPLFSMKRWHAEWYTQHVQQVSFPGVIYEEAIPFDEYAFRYDQGGFWMGCYLLQLPFLTKLISQGVFKIFNDKDTGFHSGEIQQLRALAFPGLLKRCLSRPFISSQYLWALFHRSKAWVQKRLLIQDFCIPEVNALQFYDKIKNEPGIFPIWLCPIKGTRTPQIFAPHYLSEDKKNHHVINFGLYGVPANVGSISQQLKTLENFAKSLEGRKVLYSRSCYTQEEFWQIYSKKDYEILRRKTAAEGVWHSIEDKILSEF